eukprot:1028132-Rhodomonas_salina.1
MLGPSFHVRARDTGIIYRFEGGSGSREVRSSYCGVSISSLGRLFLGKRFIRQQCLIAPCVPCTKMAELHERLSVVITTSPIRSNPATMMIEELFESFKLCPGLAECPKVVVCDGCNVADKEKYRDGKVTEDQAAKYAAFCDALEKLAEEVWSRTTIVRMPERIGFAHAAYAGLQHVETELVTVVQHDLFFVREVDYTSLCDTLMQHSGKVNYITLPGPKHLTLQQDVLSKYGIRCEFTTEFGPRLLPVIYWFDKTHVCKTSWYKSFVYGGGSGVTIPRG